MLRFALYLFGAPHIERDGISIHVERRKGLALLAYLTLSAHPISRDELATLLWPELGQREARAMLRSTLASLHRSLGHGWLLNDDDKVALAVRPDLWVDVVCFHTLLAQVAAHAHREFHLCDVCVAALTEAAGLYTAPFLAGFALADASDFEFWQTQQAELLQRELAQVLEQLAHVHAAYGRRHFQLAVDYAQRWLALDPLHEPAHRMVMQLHARTGDRAAALHQYDQCVQALAAELGVEPSLETKRLAEQIRSDPLASLERTAAALTGAPAAILRGNSLPVPATPFMGREREVEQVTARLVDPECRLLTIVGPGGIGKTRLVLQAVQELAGLFAHGIFFVDLAPVNAADLLAPTLLRALDAPGYGASEAQLRLVDFLRRKQVLLVLDSFEHLLEGVNLLTGLLHAAPGVKLLVTSRVRLNVREEWLEPLTGLDVPDTTESATFQHRLLTAAGLEDYAATRLFVHCVRRLQPGFAPSTPQDIQAVVTICRLLDGIPLGIELAVPWVRTLSLTDMQREIAHGLALLRTEVSDMPARHRSMRTVFDQSWQLLDAREQSILRQMAVFRGGCTLPAAAAVTGAELADLVRLIDKSWLRVNAAGRYEMHELVRQYCEERLETEHEAATSEMLEQVRQRHGIYYGRNLAAPMHKMNYARETIDEVMAEFGNVQAGLRWAAQAHDVTAIRWMGLTLYFVAEMLGWFHEVDQLYQMVVDLLAPEVAHRSDRQQWQEAVLLQGWILWHQSNLCLYLAQVERGRMLAESNLALLEQIDPSEDRRFLITMCWLVLAICALRGGKFESARRRFCDVLACFQDPTMPWRIYERPLEPLHLQAQAYSFLGHTAYHQGEYTEAERLMRHSRELREQIGERRYYAHHTSWLVRVLQVQGKYAEAEALVWEGLHGTQALDDRISEANALLALSRLECELGQHGPARVHLEHCIEMAKRWGHLNLLLEALAEMGRLELMLGNSARARQVGEEALDAYTRAGPVHSNNLAGVLVMLGRAALAEGDIVAAKQAFIRALTALGRPAVDTMEAVAGVAQVLAHEERLNEAAALLALVEQHPYTPYALRVQAGQTLAGLQPLPLQDVSSDLQVRAGRLGLDAMVVGLLRERA